MSNPSKQKGTRAETAVVNWLVARGYDARRREMHGGLDQADIAVAGYVLAIEVKWTASAPTAGLLDQWLAEATAEANNVTVDRYPRERVTYHPVLVHNRQRTTDVGKWIWYLWSPYEDAYMRLDGQGFIAHIEEGFAYTNG